MEQSLFLGNRRPRLLQVWLLTFCVLLCLRAGDAVKCRLCRSFRSGMPCVPNGVTCDGSFCVMAERVKDPRNKLQIKFCGEGHYEKFCGLEETTEDK
ncbi:Hypothetical predicted protein, partial [Podarcis lilfordi]